MYSAIEIDKHWIRSIEDSFEINQNHWQGKTKQFALERGKWYACEITGDNFCEDKCTYSPIKILDIEPMQTGRRTFHLDFYFANYPEGARDKRYTLQTIERGRSFLLAKSLDHAPSDTSIQVWFDRNA